MDDLVGLCVQRGYKFTITENSYYGKVEVRVHPPDKPDGLIRQHQTIWCCPGPHNDNLTLEEAISAVAKETLQADHSFWFNFGHQHGAYDNG